MKEEEGIRGKGMGRECRGGGCREQGNELEYGKERRKKEEKRKVFFFQAEEGIRDKGMGLEFRRVLVRSCFPQPFVVPPSGGSSRSFRLKAGLQTCRCVPKPEFGYEIRKSQVRPDYKSPPAAMSNPPPRPPGAMPGSSSPTGGCPAGLPLQSMLGNSEPPKPPP